MKQRVLSILIFTFVFFLFTAVSNIEAQRVVRVSSGVGTLNDAIAGDTTTTGSRVDPNTIYELEKDGYYLLTAAITNSGYHLHIKAEEGGFQKPVIRPGVISGGVSNRPFQIKGNLTLEGVYITNLDEQSKLLTNIIRMSSDGITLVVKDCQLDRDQQSAIRVDAKKTKIFITNSIISNIGEMKSADNGRGVDDRGNAIDTLVLENNTFYNLTSRILRDGGGIINYVRINHNTVVNIAQRGVTIGEAIEAHITNNIFYNCGFLGNEATNLTPNEVIETSPLGTDYTSQGIKQILEIKNNNFYLSPELSSAYPAGYVAQAFMDSVALAFVAENGTAASNLNESVKFETAAPIPAYVMVDFYDAAVTEKPDMNKGGGSPEYGGTQMPFNFGYPSSSVLFTAGTSNQPIGALTYFGIPVGVKSNAAQLPEGYELFTNYPNPFNPTTNIKYALPTKDFVKLSIYNMLGQKVATLVNELQESGLYTATWNGRADNGMSVSSGIYIYKLDAGNFSVSKKMMLVK
ncbi:MAG: T9SS type A sorting domain-containing protein [Melioribacteraceae bacterium]|nr:T9SS type A sorting domain-containing protein [Melioribacteraceae bacterium]